MVRLNALLSRSDDGSYNVSVTKHTPIRNHTEAPNEKNPSLLERGAWKTDPAKRRGDSDR
ncbi:hypothetical protein L914_05361 [Phytophthora nicotianae]|uniref:Uncharacterized protein n=2 Tax=Phytophthora nicotianae TaxID=4792 RepID=V9FHS9_PHYNI|nr:hypothetical protein F443_05551 [Phytophthora nicotianae P1569]ETM50659.1 hypothetical protein L914_05361 [Phytophthora nicotianae]